MLRHRSSDPRDLRGIGVQAKGQVEGGKASQGAGNQAVEEEGLPMNASPTDRARHAAEALTKTCSLIPLQYLDAIAIAFDDFAAARPQQVICTKCGYIASEQSPSNEEWRALVGCYETLKWAHPAECPTYDEGTNACHGCRISDALFAVDRVRTDMKNATVEAARRRS